MSTSIYPVCNQNPTKPATARLHHRFPEPSAAAVKIGRFWGSAAPSNRRKLTPGTKVVALAGSRADDSAPFEMSVENALKLLGVSESASFDEVLRAKNSILTSCKDDQEAIAKVEAAYDMVLMQRLTQRRAGKVVSSNIRYADVKPVGAAQMGGSMPPWLQDRVKNSPIAVDKPTITANLGVQAGVYGAMMALTYINGTNASSYGGADVPGLILATSFGASLYFMTKKNVKLGKASLITIGGLVAGAAVGSAVENWLQEIQSIGNQLLVSTLLVGLVSFESIGLKHQMRLRHQARKTRISAPGQFSCHKT
ncbi:hypothetical protein V2J09_016363 [Rumex salicifolius]